MVGDRASPTMGFLGEWGAGCTEPWRVVRSNEIPFVRVVHTKFSLGTKLSA